MCGIVGYVGRRDACPILIKGLHRLEYRGYDSAGVALVNPDGRLNVFKCKGKVSDLEHFLDGKDLGGNIAIMNTYQAFSLHVCQPILYRMETSFAPIGNIMTQSKMIRFTKIFPVSLLAHRKN